MSKIVNLANCWVWTQPTTSILYPLPSILYPLEIELACKPGSVESNHSSRSTIACRLKQPTRFQRGSRHMKPYLVLLRVEFTLRPTVTSGPVRSYRTLSPLPPKRRSSLCCTCRRLAPPRRYLAPYPMEPGLSSRQSFQTNQRLLGQLGAHFTFM